MDTKLFVGNLAYSVSEDDLRNLFERAGNVASVTLIKDRETGRSRGFGFVEMENQSEAEEAIRMLDGYNLNNREIKVNIARPKEDRGPRPERGPRREGSWGDRDRRGGSGGGPRRY